LISLTYLSTATALFTPTDLTQLLQISRKRNHSAALSGMLLYAGGHFIQTLEGSEEAVDATFTRIEKDPRHRDVIVALREGIEKRIFPDWSMGYETVSPEDASVLPGFNDYLDTKTISPEDGRDLGRAGIFHRVFRDRMR
jgi:hypothetical protein